MHTLRSSMYRYDFRQLIEISSSLSINTFFFFLVHFDRKKISNATVKDWERKKKIHLDFMHYKLETTTMKHIMVQLNFVGFSIVLKKSSRKHVVMIILNGWHVCYIFFSSFRNHMGVPKSNNVYFYSSSLLVVFDIWNPNPIRLKLENIKMKGWIGRRWWNMFIS